MLRFTDDSSIRKVADVRARNRMETLKVILVDDERLARAELRRLLAAEQRVEIVGEAASASAALDLVKSARPDLAFLDIHMPGVDGLQLAAELEGECRIVFCTAHEEHALEAFGLSAIDYLLKPVSAERLARCLARAVTPGSEAPRRVLGTDHPLLLSFGPRARLVRLGEIDRFQTVGNHVMVHTRHGKAFLLTPLARVEARLDPLQFIRAGRSDLLRIDAITVLEPDGEGGWLACMSDDSRVRVSRRQAQAMRRQLGGLA